MEATSTVNVPCFSSNRQESGIQLLSYTFRFVLVALLLVKRHLPGTSVTSTYESNTANRGTLFTVAYELLSTFVYLLILRTGCVIIRGLCLHHEFMALISNPLLLYLCSINGNGKIYVKAVKVLPEQNYSIPEGFLLKKSDREPRNLFSTMKVPFCNNSIVNLYGIHQNLIVYFPLNFITFWGNQITQYLNITTVVGQFPYHLLFIDFSEVC